MANSPHQQQHSQPAANHVFALTSPQKVCRVFFFTFSSFRCLSFSLWGGNRDSLLEAEDVAEQPKRSDERRGPPGSERRTPVREGRCTSGASPSPPASAWPGISRTVGGLSLSTWCVCSCVAVRRCSTPTAAERAGLKPTRRRKSCRR